MRYDEFAPSDTLAPFVHCLWMFEGHDLAELQRVVPDGRCELILHWRAPYLEPADGGWTAQPRALFAGQLTQPLHLLAREPVGVVGVRFRTAGAAAFQGGLGAFADRRTPLDDAPDLTVAPDEAARLALATAYVERRIDPRRLDAQVAVAAAAIRASAGRAPLDKLCAAAGLSPRALQRRFRDAVGVSPRMLASIVRFRRVFEALQDPGVTSWTEAAQAAGYFDHPQMARDFRRFLGCTPRQFLATGRGLAASLVDI